MRKPLFIYLAILLAWWCFLLAWEIDHASGYRLAPPPTVTIPPPALSLAQGRWFVQREVHRWGSARPGDWRCWRLSPATVACSFYTRFRVGTWRSTVFHFTLLAERQCCEYVRLWLAM